MATDDAWVWDGGRACLDFVNTLRNRWATPLETLHSPDDLTRWLRGAGLLASEALAVSRVSDPAPMSARRLDGVPESMPGSSGARRSDSVPESAPERRPGGTPESAHASARRLREAIDRAVLAVAGGGLPATGDVALINEFAFAAPRPAVQLMIRDGRLERGGAAGLPDDPIAGLGLIAQDAIELLLSPEVLRVRVCGSDRCGLRFVDRSPAHNRRWCSMSRCGNRTKVKLHQARSRAEGTSR